MKIKIPDILITMLFALMITVLRWLTAAAISSSLHLTNIANKTQKEPEHGRINNLNRNQKHTKNST